MNSISAVLLVIILIIILVRFYKLITHNYALMVRIPGPPLPPILGNLLQFIFITNDGVFKLMRHCAKTYGTFRLWSLGVGHIHNARAREAEILLSSSKHSDKSPLYGYLNDFLGTGLLISNGKKWQQRRRILTPAFHFNILHQFASIFSEESVKVIEFIRKEIECGRPVLDMSQISCRFTLNVICETAMGVKIDTMDNADEYRRSLYKVVEIIVHRIMRPWLYVDWIFQLLGYQRQVTRNVAPIHAFTRSVIKKRRETFQHPDKERNEDLSNENM